MVSPLRPLVGSVWTFTADRGGPAVSRQLILPDGCVEVIVDLRRPHVFLVGTMTVAREVEVELPARLAGIRFRPGGAFSVLGVPLPELTDREVALGELRRDAEEILGAIQGLSVEPAALALQKEIAARKMPGSTPDPRLMVAIGELTGATTPRVDDLSDRLGFSRQYLARRCKHLVGIGPKRLARIARFRRLLKLADAGPSGGWAGAAHTAGYYDQAHMIREVKELTGRTPGQLRRPA